MRWLARVGRNLANALSGQNHRELRKRLMALEKHVHDLRQLSESRDYERRLDRIDQVLRQKLRVRLTCIERDVKTVLRLKALEDTELGFPQALQAKRFGVRSQNEEDGLLLALFGVVGADTHRFVEIGCGTNGGNSGFLASELDWSGLMVDAVEARVQRVRGRFGPNVVGVEAMVTCENINDLVRDNGCAGDIDLLSIDIDGNDIWIWNSISACRPRVVVIEYNALFGADRAVAVPYDPGFDRHTGTGHIYYGASPAAMTEMGKRKGYRLVVTEPEGVNAFFVRDDLAPEIPALDPAVGYRPRYEQLRRGIDLYAHIQQHDLPLVEVTAETPVTASPDGPGASG